MRARAVARVVLGVALALAGITHLTSKRLEFQAQVPDWVILDKNLVVVLSGLVEIALGDGRIVGRSPARGGAVPVMRQMRPCERSRRGSA